MITAGLRLCGDEINRGHVVGVTAYLNVPQGLDISVACGISGGGAFNIKWSRWCALILHFQLNGYQ